MYENDSQSDAHPEASISQSQMTRKSGTEETPDTVTGVQAENQFSRQNYKNLVLRHTS